MTAPREEELEPRPDQETPPEVADPQLEEESEEPEELSPEEILAAERDAFEQKWLRVVAELDNVRKRSRREIQETRRFAQADILRALLEIQDNFERALHSATDSSDTGETDGIREGVELIFQKFRGVLKDRGVEPMEAVGAEFDPNFHEAVGQIEREGVPSGQVVEVVQQGFYFQDMVLRPARVIISS